VGRTNNERAAVNAGLEIIDVGAGYGHIDVLHGVSISVSPGEIVCLLGPNGAGKTTLLLGCVGQLPLRSGHVLVDGRPVSSKQPNKAAQLGIAFVPDNRGLFLQLSVAENLRLVHPWRSSMGDVAELFPALPPLMSRRVGLLSGGEQQMVALAKAVLFRPKVLLIDEMSHGLAPLVAEKLLKMVKELAQRHNTAVLLVEQTAEMALAVSDRALVMRQGRIVMEGAASEVHANRDVLESHYLGHTEQTTVAGA
jgi:branched-chain amino acid transport system ATP-binding protein